MAVNSVETSICAAEILLLVVGTVRSTVSTAVSTDHTVVDSVVFAGSSTEQQQPTADQNLQKLIDFRHMQKMMSMACLSDQHLVVGWIFAIVATATETHCLALVVVLQRSELILYH